MIDEAKIRRINELSRKAKSPEGLTEEEIKERTLLRQEYVAAVRMNLCASWIIPILWTSRATSRNCSGKKEDQSSEQL